MKILHIISSLEIGGAQKLITDLLPLLKQKGCNVSLLVLKGIDCPFQKQLKDEGIIVYELGISNYYSPLIIIRLIPFLRKFDIIHAHLFPVLYWVAIASIFSKAMLIYTEHSTNNKRRAKFWLRPIEKIIYNFYDKIISISEQTDENLRIWLNADAGDSRFVIIDNGIKREVFANAVSTLIFSNDKNNQKNRYLIMISRFTQAKDHETVIKSMKEVIDPFVHLLFVGSGDTLHREQELVNELNLSDKIHFLGVRNDIPQLIKSSYIGIQSSNWEGFGLTAVELMAGGIPVVASNVEGLKQVVGGAGLLFERGNNKQLATIVNKLLSNQILYDDVKLKCMERSRKYDVITMVNKYLMVYKSL